MKSTNDDRELAGGILEAIDDPRLLVRRLREYYGDADRADRTSRAQLYLHIGLVSGALMRVLDTAKDRN